TPGRTSTSSASYCNLLFRNIDYQRISAFCSSLSHFFWRYRFPLRNQSAFISSISVISGELLFFCFASSAVNHLFGCGSAALCLRGGFWFSIPTEPPPV